MKLQLVGLILAIAVPIVLLIEAIARLDPWILVLSALVLFLAGYCCFMAGYNGRVKVRNGGSITDDPDEPV